MSSAVVRQVKYKAGGAHDKGAVTLELRGGALVSSAEHILSAAKRQKKDDGIRALWNRRLALLERVASPAPPQSRKLFFLWHLAGAKDRRMAAQWPTNQGGCTARVTEHL